MSGKEFEQLLQILPDLAAKYARQRFWKLVRVWSLRAGITALAVAGGVALLKVALDAQHPAAVSTNAPAASNEPAAIVESPAPQTQTGTSASSQTPYDLPNPEIRQEFFLQRTPPATRPAR